MGVTKLRIAERGTSGTYIFFVKKAVSEEEEVILILHLEFESFCL